MGSGMAATEVAATSRLPRPVTVADIFGTSATFHPALGIDDLGKMPFV